MSPFKFSSKPPVSLGKSFSPAKRGKFQIYDVAKWKMHYQVKKNEVTIFTDAKVSLRLFSSPFRQREITHPPPFPTSDNIWTSPYQNGVEETMLLCYLDK